VAPPSSLSTPHIIEPPHHRAYKSSEAVPLTLPDDEKYLLQRDVKKQAEMLKKIKGKKPIDLLRHYKRMAHDNIKDIIACGFILEKTYIFQDSQAMG
jgi:tryptophanyl-tRNA synthetase